MTPGTYHIALGGPAVGLAARRAGIEVRDCILVAGPAGVTSAWLLRAPLKGTAIDAVLEHARGALHIDACRIYTDWNEADRPASWKASGHSSKPEADKIAAPPGTGIVCHPAGRWPPNTIFVHARGCQRDGTKAVKGITGGLKGINRHERLGGGPATPHDFFNYTSEDGTETVASWACVTGCLVALLDDQSGQLHARGNTNPTYQGGGLYGLPKQAVDHGARDAGGASRFFPQLDSIPVVERWFRTLVGAVPGT